MKGAFTLGLIGILAARPAAAEGPQVGAIPPADAVPRVEFAFEGRVTLAPAVVLGNTALGHRQYIPITGGSVAGPKLKGQVVPGGWDFQLTYSASDCTQLSADYFLKADDGTVIHVFNEGLVCPGGARSLFRPRLEAPKGAFEWLTHATFVATLEVEPDGRAVRIRFYQVK
ncbi:MAG TPA: DUF3237 domain-containing protein [Steroidobacteraceae bacterium]|nr:DUF3237 domain-containing protein [Steroidobacteraceae bacterium]